jgi:hypothetical protein
VPTPRSACRTYLEAWLRPLAEQTGEVRIHAEKRMTQRATVHVFNRVLNHADCYRYLGTSIGDLKDRIDDFVAQHPVLQAWHSQCTWHPLFDHADDYHRTVYEENSGHTAYVGLSRAAPASSVLNWFRGILQTDSGLNASRMSLQWCRNVLRMDRAALEAVAQVTEATDAFNLCSEKVRSWTISSTPCCQFCRLKA